MTLPRFTAVQSIYDTSGYGRRDMVPAPSRVAPQRSSTPNCVPVCTSRCQTLKHQNPRMNYGRCLSDCLNDLC